MLRMVGFGDNIGSGFRKILAAWKSIGYAHPDIHEEEDVNEVWLTLPLLKKSDSINPLIDGPKESGNDPNKRNNVPNDTESDPNKGTNVPDDTENDPNKGTNVPNHIESDPNKGTNVPNDTENDPNKELNTSQSYSIKKRRKKILELLHSNPEITTDILMDILGVSRKTVTRDLVFLSKEGKLSREGGSFGGKWVVLNK